MASDNEINSAVALSIRCNHDQPSSDSTCQRSTSGHSLSSPHSLKRASDIYSSPARSTMVLSTHHLSFLISSATAILALVASYTSSLAWISILFGIAPSVSNSRPFCVDCWMSSKDPCDPSNSVMEKLNFRSLLASVGKSKTCRGEGKGREKGH